MGRPPKTQQQHDRDGTARHHRHDDLADSPNAAGELMRPDWITGEAAAMWDCVVPLILEVTGVGKIDSFQLAAMCDWWGLYREKRESGNDWRDANTAKAAFESFNRIASRFGLTPLDRQALHSQRSKTNDKANKYFGVVG